MKRPDITLAQIVGAAIAAIYPVLTLIGVDLSQEQKAALDDLFIVAIGLFGADAAIRFGRSRSPLPLPESNQPLPGMEPKPPAPAPTGGPELLPVNVAPPPGASVGGLPPTFIEGGGQPAPEPEANTETEVDFSDIPPEELALDEPRA